MNLNAWIPLIAASGAIVTMLLGTWLVFDNLKLKGKGFGPNSLRSLGMVLFIPSLILVPIIVPEFGKETLSALLGTVAGYVLSQTRNNDDGTPASRTPSSTEKQ